LILDPNARVVEAFGDKGRDEAQKRVDYESTVKLAAVSPVTRRCFGPVAKKVFQVRVEPSTSFGAAIKKVIYRDTGLILEPEVRVAPGAYIEEHDALLTRIQLAEFFGGKASD
jgi:hypothetical protein